jgi:substrate import-associated zinc metallohydrolase lipoprotein
MTMKYSRRWFICWLVLVMALAQSSCYNTENINLSVTPPPDLIKTDLDIYINENFIEEFDMAIRYRFVDNYVGPTQRVTPPRLVSVRPMLDFIEEFWIDPYLEVENGDEFFRNHVPAEIILLGGLIYNEDGTVTLGSADAGARITFTDVNSIDVNDEDWVLRQLNTVYHEFAHIVHQNYKLPPAFETITPQGYTSAGSWFVLSDDDALKRGFVSPYATSSPNEDFAETVAFYLFDKDFHENFITQEENCLSPDCEEKNAGRLKINEKLNSIRAHYEKVTGVNLDDVRASVQSRLN